LHCANLHDNDIKHFPYVESSCTRNEIVPSYPAGASGMGLWLSVAIQAAPISDLPRISFSLFFYSVTLNNTYSKRRLDKKASSFIARFTLE
jgi:hypothetical protein